MIYATYLSSKPDSKPASISWGIAPICVVLLAITGLGLQNGAAWSDAPEYLPVFAPRAHHESYRASVSRLGLDEVLGTLRDDPSAVQTPGGWAARSLLPFDAFGRSGGYDRSKLARLYGGRRVRVARGPRLENGRIVESWTLVSPYPSVSLERLEPGTLRIVQRLPAP